MLCLHNSVYANPAIFQKDYNTASKIANELKQDKISFTQVGVAHVRILKKTLPNTLIYLKIPLYVL